MFRGGYLGRVLRVDLTVGTAVTEALAPQTARDYLGGAGFGMKYLYGEVAPSTHPLSPQNKLVFAPGPLTATLVPCTSLMTVTAKSARDGGVAAAVTGGGLPEALKHAGWDVLIIQGRAEQPVYLCLDGGRAELRAADRLWGSQTPECERRLGEMLQGDGFRLACVGPAGEALSLQATIVSEGRGAGQGLGAVMGAKRLKAIAVRGSGSVAVSDEAKLRFALGQMREQLANPSHSSQTAVRDRGQHHGGVCAGCPLRRRRARPAPPVRHLCDDLGVDWMFDTPPGEQPERSRAWLEDLRTATCDCPTMCAFLLDTSLADTTAENAAALVEAVTGMMLTPGQIVEVGARVNNLTRAFESRCRPGAAWPEPDARRRAYYGSRGWERETGVPTRAGLEALGLSHVADDLWGPARSPETTRVV